MNTASPALASSPSVPMRRGGPSAVLVGVTLLAWMVIATGFFGLRILMQERPQFVGQPLLFNRGELLQESPTFLVRKESDDVSVIRRIQPDTSEVHFQLQGHRDHRGLKTLLDMSGAFRARHLLTNAYAEPIFVLVRYPHPRTADGAAVGIAAGGLKLVASLPGQLETARDGWLWTGRVDAGAILLIDVTYEAAALQKVAYRVGEQAGGPVPHVRITVDRSDLARMRFETGDGALADAGASLIWERRDFLAPETFTGTIVEGRSLHDSLLQLLEIGPVVCLLFLATAAALVLTARELKPVQLLTVAVGYAWYFPLAVYLSARFNFGLALGVAVGVPGVLLANYARLQFGSWLGLIVFPALLICFQLFPTLAAFAGWNRGMVLLCLGLLTFTVLLHLQNRTVARASVALLLGGFGLGLEPVRADSGVAVLLPPEWIRVDNATNADAAAARIAFQPAKYEARQEEGFFTIAALLPFEVLRSGIVPQPLFPPAVHVQSLRILADSRLSAHVALSSNRLALFASAPGTGTVHCVYRAPIVLRGDRRHTEIPVFSVAPGTVHLASSVEGLEFLTGSAWSRMRQASNWVHEVGTTGQDPLVVEWDDAGGSSGNLANHSAPSVAALYGIAIPRAQHLTVINSDGSCAHFAEIELARLATNVFHLRLPVQARVVSVSLDDVEIPAPTLDQGWVRIPLSASSGISRSQRLSFRLAYPTVRLGFAGQLDLSLPEFQHTVGTLSWVVALPGGFDRQVISSGLEVEKASPDLSRFGEYGQILKNTPTLALGKSLAPPGAISLSLRYRQSQAWLGAAENRAHSTAP